MMLWYSLLFCCGDGGDFTPDISCLLGGLRSAWMGTTFSTFGWWIFSLSKGRKTFLPISMSRD